MDFGLHLGTRGATAGPEGLRAMARHCEALGYWYLGFNDHVIIAKAVESKYPYDKSGLWPASDTGTCLEQLMTIAYVAAVTEKIRLLTSVMVLPHRAPVLAAKMLATADVLSNGRLTVGVGIGWMAEEMAALQSPPFDRRAQASQEYIEAFRALWTEPAPAYAGDFVSFDAVLFDPKPVQRPHPPIWVGGEGKAARRRAGQLGDGWYPVIANPRQPLDTPARFTAALAEVHRHAEAADRDPAALDTALFAPWYSLGAPRADEDGKRRPFTGAAEQIAADAEGYRGAGLNHLIIGFESDDLQMSLDRTEQFATEVMAL